MKSLLSATAALALLAAAGQAGAQTSPSDTSNKSNDSSMSSSAAPSGDAAKTDSSSAAPDTAGQDQGAKPEHRMGYSHSESAANRREAKITNNLNEQELSKDDKGASSTSPETSTGSSSSNSKKMHSGWHDPTKPQPSDTAGSGSSSGSTAAPSAGSDTIGDTQSRAVPHTSGDRAAAPDSNAPEFANGMTAPNNSSDGQ